MNNPTSDPIRLTQILGTVNNPTFFRVKKNITFKWNGFEEAAALKVKAVAKIRNGV